MIILLAVTVSVTVSVTVTVPDIECERRSLAQACSSGP